VTPGGIHPWDRPAPEASGLPSAWSLLPEDLEALGCPGNPRYFFGRLNRYWQWKDGAPALGTKTRQWLETRSDVGLPRIVERHASTDGTTKLALELADGKRIETVHMPREVRSPRVTLCLSSQVGCALGCAFCATGAMGIVRNLSAGEIVGQALVALHELGPRNPSTVTFVFMGMGEPLHNLDAVHRAIRSFTHLAGLGIPTRRITVSTSGLVPGIDRLSKLEPRPWLALSLSAGSDEVRNSIMPVNRAYPLADVMAAIQRWNLKPREKLTFEYVLLEGINDSDADAKALVATLGEFRHRHNLNLIPMNEHTHSPIRGSSEARLQGFVEVLKAGGCFVTVRRSRGQDVKAACGQLINGGGLQHRGTEARGA
jgi:23S rRNA (adenine2503-C2)-methyltransferase